MAGEVIFSISSNDSGSVDSGSVDSVKVLSNSLHNEEVKKVLVEYFKNKKFSGENRVGKQFREAFRFESYREISR